MKKLIVLFLMIAIVLFTACEPTTGSEKNEPMQYGTIYEENNKSIRIFNSHENPNKPHSLSYLEKLYSSAEVEEFFYFYDMGEPQNDKLAIYFDSSELFYLDRWDKIKISMPDYSWNEEVPINKTGEAQYNSYEKLYSLIFIYNIDDSIKQFLSRRGEIEIELLNNSAPSKNMAFIIPTEFSEYLEKYF